MGRPAPEPGKEHQSITISLPRNLADEFYAEAGDGYGSRTALFRRMFQTWMHDRRLREQLETERRLRVEAEGRLSRIRAALR